MNKHINQNKKDKPLPEGIAQYSPDGMPKQVATELLCTGNLTGPLRRSAESARVNYFGSTRVRKPPEERLARKIKEAKINQIHKWLKRAIDRRMQAQRAYLRVIGTTPLHDRLRTQLELKAATCDVLRDACELEIANRKATFTNKVIDPKIKRRNALIAAVSHSSAIF